LAFMKNKYKVEHSMVWHRLSRVIKWIPVLFIAALLLFIATAQVPRIQTTILNSLTTFVSQNTSYRLTIGHANLTWYDQMVFKEINISNTKNDSTLFAARAMAIDVSLIQYLLHKEIVADNLTLINPEMHLIKPTDDESLNLSEFLYELKQVFAKSPDKKKSTISIKEVSVEAGQFSFNHIGRDSIRSGKDIYHGQYNNINAEIANLSFDGSNLGAFVTKLSASDQAKQLSIDEMAGLVSLSTTHLSLSNLSLGIGHSHISDSIVLKFTRPDDLRYLSDSVDIALNLSSSVISGEDLKLFSSNSTPLFNQDYIISGQFSGRINNLSVDKLVLQKGESYISGGGLIHGLPNLSEAFIDFIFSDTKLSSNDLTAYFGEDLSKEIEGFGNISVNGEFSGFFSDFVANGTIETAAGVIKPDINLKINSNGTATYEGFIALEGFRPYLISTTFDKVKKINMQGTINGSGLNLHNAKFDLKARVDSVQINNYNFVNLSTKGHFEENFLSASVDIKDPNLMVDGQVEVDLRHQVDQLKVSASLDSVNLNAIGVLPYEIVVHSNVDIDMQGLQINEMTGHINLNQTRLSYQHRKLALDSVRFISTKANNIRTMRLETDGLLGKIEGNFESSALFSGITRLSKEIGLNIVNDLEEIETYYYNKKQTELNELHATMSLWVLNPNKFIQPFFSEYSITGATKLDATIEIDSVMQFTMYTAIDSAGINQFQAANNVIQIDLSKNYFSNDIYGTAYIYSQDQTWSDDIRSQNSSLELEWLDNQLNISAKTSQPEYDNQIELNSTAKFLPDQTIVHMTKSKTQLLDQKWKWHPDNQLTIQNKKLTFSKFSLSNGLQVIELNGSYNIDTYEQLVMNMSNIEIATFQSLLPIKLDGTLNGSIGITSSESDLYQGNMIISNVKIDDKVFGNIHGSSSWNTDSKTLDLNLDLINNRDIKLSINGSYNPNEVNEGLVLKAKINQFDLKMAAPLFEGSFDQLEGSVSGNLSIGGTLLRPTMRGQVHSEAGKVIVKYLNTQYNFNGDLDFQDNKIFVNNFNIIDQSHNTATLGGNIEYSNIDNLELFLDGSFNNFTVLNTSSVDNKLYYGSAFGTGTVQFRGTPDNIRISANARTTRGTRLSFPIGSSSETGLTEKEYIQFVKLTEDKNSGSVNENGVQMQTKSQIKKGVVLNLDLEMTPDAYVEMIFDIKSGDIIRGRGNGNLKLEVNSDGDFNMFGDYIIEQGGYNFTLYNIINKEFQIENGSSISWYGDPYGAQLQIDADYKQFASLAPLISDLSDTDANSPEMRKKYSTLVDLSLTGDLLTPNIDFDIRIEDYPRSVTIANQDNKTYDLERYVNAFRTRVSNNEQEMNRQVFSLVVLRKLSPEENFQINSETIGSSFSEFISNQLSYWANQVDENLEIDVDLSSLDQEAFNTFQLRLSYTFLDGRLRVTRGGGLPGEQTKDDLYAIIGDWSVEYLLTDDGRFRAKLYSRSDLNAIDRQTGDNALETGISLQYVKSFDELSKILKASRAKNLSPNTNPSSTN
jgi:hypothetical protein